MSDQVLTLTDDEFEQIVLKSDIPVIVDFWAEWCGPCKAFAPTLEEAAVKYNGRIKVGKLNIEEQPQAPQKYGIRAIPTLMIFKNGEVQGTKTGAMLPAQLEAFIEENL